MPFTASGIVPDLIINCHCMPSRMTIGQLIESLVGKVAVLKGTIGDGTPFRGLSVSEVAKELSQYGFEKYGKEQMYCGLTGEPLECLVFQTPTYYQRLRHMARDKMHARASGPLLFLFFSFLLDLTFFFSIGPVQTLTRQPVEGRSRNGGLRCGE